MGDYDLSTILGVNVAEELEERSKDEARKKAPAQTKRAYRSKRDKRVQVVMSQALYDKIKDESIEAGASVNEVINVILENALKRK